MQLITAKEVCRLLRIEMTTLSRWRKKDAFPKPTKPAKKNGKLLWVLSDIELWIKESK